MSFIQTGPNVSAAFCGNYHNILGNQDNRNINSIGYQGTLTSDATMKPTMLPPLLSQHAMLYAVLEVGQVQVDNTHHQTIRAVDWKGAGKALTLRSILQK